MNFLSPEDTFQYIPSLPRGNLLEAGVYHGDILTRLIKGAIDQGHPFRGVFGFDSWVGLPEEADNVYKNPDWPKAAFSVKERYGLKSDDECKQLVTERVWDAIGEKTFKDLHDFQLISGFFIDSMTENLGNYLKNSASYCHVDCDLYISTKQVLDWLFTYQVPKEGCLLRFDDWLSTPLWTAGNSKAFMEATHKYKLMWTPIGCNCFIFNGYVK